MFDYGTETTVSCEDEVAATHYVYWSILSAGIVVTKCLFKLEEYNGKWKY